MRLSQTTFATITWAFPKNWYWSRYRWIVGLKSLK